MHAESFAKVLDALAAGQDLASERMAQVMQSLMAGKLSDRQAGDFLLALRAKGETAEELASAALVLREHMVRWDPGRDNVLDTCGTGGDGAGTFNISTGTALVVAAIGVPV